MTWEQAEQTAKPVLKCPVRRTGVRPAEGPDGLLVGHHQPQARPPDLQAVRAGPPVLGRARFRISTDPRGTS